MRDITDFSAKDSKGFNKSTALYADALEAADRSLLGFKESTSGGKVTTFIRKKTHNSKQFLNEDYNNARKMNMNTNAVAEFVKANKSKLKENLMFGATEEDLEKEVTGSLGRDILAVFEAHNVTGKAVWDVIDILKNFVGKEPDIEELLTNWESNEGDEDTDVDEGSEEDFSDEESEEDFDEGSDETEETEEDEEMDESVEEFPKTLEEMTKTLRRKIAEKRIRDRARR